MKMMKNKHIGFIVALSIPLLILIGLTVKPLWALTYGDDITLVTVPVDPRDLLYGDYVTLRYEIEEVPKNEISTAILKKIDKRSNYNELTVYGTLVQQGDVYVLDNLSDEKPTGSIYLTGKLNGYDYQNVDGVKVHSINFGLDRYYVPENTGKELEDLSARGQLVAHLKVKNGYGILKEITTVK
ncbi:GDYXXLXY domain-containing protein [Sporosarcina sp. ANT_H38]|uniref:GDYXXLXY domain-containing protein n=1 Tax=Sporosarcina sp. ANT_H38 TaxID=2597358 RepID=UPI0021034BCE|nr:GDYXXLXY domain-containing protein [Sporosarcina sp. ANT_H38]